MSFKRFVFQKIEANLKDGVILAFAHGFNIHFGKIKPTDDISVVMIAPKGPGHTVRSTYMSGGGVPSLIAIYRDSISTKDFNAKDVALICKSKWWNQAEF